MKLTKSGDKYEINKREYERVTRIIGVMGGGDYLVKWACKLTAEASAGFYYSEEDTNAVMEAGIKATRQKADRGTVIHELIADELEGRTTLTSVPYRGYIDGAIKFLNDYEITVIRTEVLLADPLGYAGTADVWGEDNEGSLIVDWKTGKPHNEHELQLNAYCNAMNWARGDKLEQTPIFRKGMVVYLDGDGYKVETYMPSDEAYDAFLGLFAAWRWKNDS